MGAFDKSLFLKQKFSKCNKYETFLLLSLSAISFKNSNSLAFICKSFFNLFLFNVQQRKCFFVHTIRGIYANVHLKSSYPE